jgi:hypothetical protein
LGGLAGEQLWRHGRDYVFPDQFAVVVPEKIYRGAWQQPWPMRRIVSKYKIKTVLALAHPPTHPLAMREKAMAGELGYRWVHIPIVDQRDLGDPSTISDQLEKAAAVLADPHAGNALGAERCGADLDSLRAPFTMFRPPWRARKVWALSGLRHERPDSTPG